MELRWVEQADGAWYAYGQRKKDTSEKAMGKILPPSKERDYWYWLFFDENIAGGGHDVPAIKRYMEWMVQKQ